MIGGGKVFSTGAPQHSAIKELHAIFGNISAMGPKFFNFIKTLPKAGTVVPLESGRDEGRLIELLLSEGIDPQDAGNVVLATERGWDLLLIAEHHRNYLELTEAKSKLAKLGWFLSGVPGRQGPTTGVSGGTCILARMHLAVRPFGYSPAICREPHPSLGHGHDWNAVEVHLRKGALVLIVLYFDHTIGLAGPNEQKAREIVDFVQGLKGPVAMAGDFNMTPEEVIESGFLTMFGTGHQMKIRAPNVPFTCTAGKGRVLDYWIVNDQADALMPGVNKIPGCPWKVHGGIGTSFSCTPAAIVVPKFVRPKDIRAVAPEDLDMSVQTSS